MINYSLLDNVQIKDLAQQIEIFKKLYFEAISMQPCLGDDAGPEYEAISLLTQNVSENKKWLNIVQIKELIGNKNLSNTRLGYALKKHNVLKKRGKIKGDNINVYSLYLI